MKHAWLGFALLALVAAGCKAERTIMGDWRSTGIPEGTVSFNPDQTFQLTSELRGNTIVLKGTYEYNEPRLKLNLSGVEFNGMPVPDEVRKQVVKGDAQNQEASVSWKNNDTIILSGEMMSGSFTRVRP